MGEFFAELKRRHIYRVAAAYAVVAWVVLQLVNNVAPGLNLPNWAVTLTIVFLTAGFPIALLFAWILQLASADGAVAHAAAGRLDWFLAAGLAAVIGLASYEQFQRAPVAVPARTSQAPAAEGLSVAVLPFVNLSGDAGQDFFSDGMTEEITSALAKIQNLRVVGRTSAFEFKGQNKDLVAIGQALRATHLIEGSVRKAGERVRITAQLIKADDGTHVWTENYDRQLTDIFAIQEDIAGAIAAALKVPLGLAQGETLVSGRTLDLETYDQYLRAKAQYRERGTGVLRATAILEQVVVRDPAFASAWALLAQVYSATPLNTPEGRTGSPDQRRRLYQSAREKAEKAAREAIRLDGRNAMAYAVLASIQAGTGKWAAADDLYKQALALDPNEPELLSIYSSTLTGAGRLKEASRLVERLTALDALIAFFRIQTAVTMQFNGDVAAGISILEAIPADAVGGYNRSVYLSWAYAAQGRYTEAADVLLGIQTNLVSRKSIEDAARILRNAPAKLAETEALPAFESASLNVVFAYGGAPEKLLEYFERIADIREPYSDYMIPIWLPTYANLRKTERFKAFMRSAGLVDYWHERGWPDLCRPAGADDFVCD